MEKRSSSWQWAKHQKMWFGKWHTYLGIFAGAIVSLIGFTGSILVFQEEIDRALNPKLFEVAAQSHRLSFSEVVHVMKKRFPEYEVASIGNIDVSNPNLPYRISLLSKKAKKNRIEVFLNPFNGNITGKRNFQSSLMQVVTRLHMSLLLSAPGRILAGLSTLVLLIITISGLRLWIPAKWKHLKSVLTVKFSTSFKRQNYDWHNVIGFYTAPVVIMLCLTGFSLNIGIFAAPALLFTGGEKLEAIGKLINARSVVKKGTEPISMDQLSGIVKKVMPDGQIKGIYFPANPAGVYSVEMANPGKIYPTKIDIIMIDQYSGKVIFNTTKDFKNIGNAYVTWIRPLHYGSFGGLPTKILAFLGGLSPLVLFITGIIVWWPRYRKQRKDKQFTQKANKTPSPQIGIHEPTLIAVFLRSIRSGTRYALWIALVSFISGALYGFLSGTVIEPGILAFYMVFGIIILNFIIALITILVSSSFRIILWGKRKIGIRGAVRYFGLSLSFLLIFLILFFVASRSGIATF